MKALVVLLGLITAALLPGEAAVKVTIRVYNGTEELDIINRPLILSTRISLTCDVTGLPNNSEVLSYRWYHKCTSHGCEIQNDSYYRVVSDTLSINVTSHDQGGFYYCFVQFLQKTLFGQSPFISVAGGTRTPMTTTPGVSRESLTPTPVVNTTPTTVSTTTTARSTSNSSNTPSGPQTFSRIPFNTQPVGTFVGVGVGVGMFLLLVLLTSVVVLILVVVVRRKGANKRKRGTPLPNNRQFNNSVVVTQEMEMKKEGVTADNAYNYQDVDYDKGEDDNPVEDVFNHYEFDDSTEHIMNTKTPATKEFCTSLSASNVPVVYAVMDKSKKKGSKVMVEKGSVAATMFNMQYQ